MISEMTACVFLQSLWAHCIVTSRVCPKTVVGHIKTATIPQLYPVVLKSSTHTVNSVVGKVNWQVLYCMFILVLRCKIWYSTVGPKFDIVDKTLHGFILRTFTRKFSNIDFFLKILPLKDDELVMSEKKKKIGGSLTSFWREHARKNT